MCAQLFALGEEVVSHPKPQEHHDMHFSMWTLNHISAHIQVGKVQRSPHHKWWNGDVPTMVKLAQRVQQWEVVEMLIHRTGRDSSRKMRHGTMAMSTTWLGNLSMKYPNHVASSSIWVWLCGDTMKRKERYEVCTTNGRECCVEDYETKQEVRVGGCNVRVDWPWLG